MTDGSREPTLLAPGRETTTPEQGRTDPLLERGATVGRYVVLEQIGRGGMGVVYAAYDPQLDRKVAFKILHRQRSEADATRLLREAQAMARVSHPNVVAVHDVGTFDDRVFVAMEYVEGGELRARQQECSWSEVLALYVQAGRGLAAAHQAGLIHRDFKPENAFVGDDGRVRVLDFGLALPIGEQPQDLSGELGLESVSTLDTTSDRLTQLGDIVGTPSYMSPEQFMNQDVGAASDQFSFCVALFEAVYGCRPFVGDNVAALAFQVVQGKPRSPPVDASAPAWLKQALLRGLSTAPQDRWPSMDALVEELVKDRQPVGRARWYIGFGGIALAGLVAFAAWADVRRNRVSCDQGEAAMSQSWNDAQRAKVRAGLERGGAAHAATTAERVIRAFDAYAAQWVQSRDAACVATHEQHSQSETMLERQVACLDNRKAELGGMVEILTTADEQVSRRALTAAYDLTSIESCTDGSLLRREVEPPPPEIAVDVAQIRERASAVGAMVRAGGYASALEEAEVLLERARALGYAPLILRVRLQVLAATHVGKDNEVAAASYEQLSWDAIAQGNDYMAFRAVAKLASIRGGDMVQVDDGLRWCSLAEALLERLGGDPSLEADLRNVEGAIYFGARRLPEAQQAWERASVLFRGSGRRGLEINLGIAAIQSEDYAAARRYLEAALDEYERDFGPDHPNTARAHNNLGIAFDRLDEHDAALGHLLKALTIKEKLYGADHPSVASTLGNMARIEAEEAKFASARDHYLRAMKIFEETLGPDHPHVASCLDALSTIELELEDAEQSLAFATRAVAVHHKLDNGDPRRGGKLRLAECRRARAAWVLEPTKESRGALEASARAAVAHEGVTEGDLETLREWLTAHGFDGFDGHDAAGANAVKAPVAGD